MRTYQQTVRVGECVGPVDWEYNFTQHDWGANKGGLNPEMTPPSVERLRAIESGLAAGEKWEATTDGGWPRVGWHDVLQVGMYDGWPHWRPVPSILTMGPLGPEWHQFYSVTDARKINAPERDAETE